MTEFNKNFLEISKNYQYFIFDVWGVIHDGISAYPNSVEAIKTLHDQGKKICFLSNAPRRAKKVVQVLKNYGIEEKFYDFVLTSGEAVFEDLELNQKNNFNKFGKKYFYIGPQKDIDLLSGLDYEIVNEPALADFALTTGFDDETSTLEEKLPQILQAKEHHLPLICANPDMIVIRKDGREMLCSGEIAQKYQQIGGEVFYYGKPYEAVYHKVLQKLNVQNHKREILAIGDGLETDIKGANNFGIKSILATGGILANKLGIKFNEKAAEENVVKQCEIYGAYPDYVIATL